MMTLKSSLELVGKPVTGLAQGTGRVANLAGNLATKKVLGFVVTSASDGEIFLPVESVVFGQRRLEVEKGGSADDAGAPAAADSVPEMTRLVGAAVLNPKGQLLGHVREVSFDVLDGSIMDVQIRDDRGLPIWAQVDRLVGGGEGVLVVSDRPKIAEPVNLEDAKAQLARLHRQRENLLAVGRAYRKRLTLVESALGTRMEQLKTSEKAVRDGNREIHILESRLNQIKQAEIMAARQREELARVRAEKVELAQKLEGLETRQTGVDAELSTLRHSAVRLERERDVLKGYVREHLATGKGYEETIGAMSEEIEILKTALKQRDGTLSEARVELDTRYVRGKGQEEEIENQDEEIKVLKNSLEEQDEVLRQARVELDSRIAAAKAQEDSIRMLREEIETLKKSLVAQGGVLEQTRLELESRVAATGAREPDIVNQREKSAEETRRLLEDNERLSAKVLKLQTRLDELLARHKAALGRIDELSRIDERI